MAPKHNVVSEEVRNLPIPLVLFTSYIAAQKSDELIKVFCKELPGILKNINDGKKALQNRTKAVYKLKEDIKVDLKKLELSNIVLKELLAEEEIKQTDKEKEQKILYSQISTCQDSEKSLKNCLVKFSQFKHVLDSIAVESKRYRSAQTLIQSYLTLQAINEKLIKEEFECEYIKNIEEEKLEVQRLLLKHKYDIMTREKKLEKLSNEHQRLKNINYSLYSSMNEILCEQKQKQLDWIYIKRWAYDTCQSFGAYKETPSTTEDFLKLLNEIVEVDEARVGRQKFNIAHLKGGSGS